MLRAQGPTKSVREILFKFNKDDRVSTVSGWILFVGLVLVLTAVINIAWEALPSNIQVGSIASRDIHSDRAYTIVDEKATQDLRDKAEARILPLFRFDSKYMETVSEKVNVAFSKVRQEYEQMQEAAQETDEEILPQDVEKLRTLFSDLMGISVSVRDFETVIDRSFDPALQENLLKVLTRILKDPIVEETEELDPFRETGIRIMGVEENATEREIAGDKLREFRTVEDVRTMVTSDVAKLSNDGKIQHLLENIVVEHIQITLLYDRPETAKQRQAATAEVEGVLIRIQPGESIIRRGDRFEARDISIIEGIKKAKAKRNFRWKFVGTGIFVFFFLICAYAFAARYLHRFNPNRRDLACLSLTLVLVLAVCRIGLSIGQSVLDVVPFDIPISAIYYALPIAGGAMGIRLVRNAQEAFLIAIVSAVLIGLTPDIEIHYMIYYLSGSVVAAGALTHADTRAAVWKAGLWTGLVQMALVISFELIRSIEIMAVLTGSGWLWNMGFALGGGLMSALMTHGFASFAESIFGYLTDIKLLELGSLNHPLLRELVVRAPGTYHHSHMVGILAEAGSRAIGANALFARVASYFHDIGKMAKPEYFIENQKGGENRHDSLSPSMSALIIQNHVKDGIEMARQHGLPEQIVDVIPQHQGKKLIRYFYSKAKEQENEDVSSVDEKDYRYPGPRPQSREAGIILLADSAEAATRALVDKSPAKIRSVVEKMININFTDGQLDECDLTLKGLHDISDAFTSILTGIYHQRIEYPDIPKGKQEKSRKGIHVEQDNSPQLQPVPSSSEADTAKITRPPLRDALHKS